MDQNEQTKKEPKTLVRSSRSAVFQMAQPGQPPQTMYGEVNAVYVDNQEDVDTLVGLMAAGRQYVCKTATEGHPEIVIIQGVFPSKIATVSKGVGDGK